MFRTTGSGRSRSRSGNDVDILGHKSIGPGRTLPPPPGKAELKRARPPRGRRTPSTTRTAPDLGKTLPSNAPGWMKRARRLAGALEQAIKAGDVDGSAEAAIERAFAAFELGSSDKQISRVAHLVDRAHRAIRDTARNELESAILDCAEVLHQGLPAHVQKAKSFDGIVAVVRYLRSEADGWTAVVEATARILGWTDAAGAHGARAIRVALNAEPPSSEQKR